MGDIKKELIIVIAVIAVILLVVIISAVTKVKISYGISKSQNDNYKENLITSYEEFQNFITKVDLDTSAEVDLKTKSVSSYYNDKFFEKNNLVVILVPDDTSKERIYSIDKLEYSNGKKNATVTYTYKEGAYLGTLGNTWYDVMMLKVDKKVTDVSLVKSAEK